MMWSRLKISPPRVCGLPQDGNPCCILGLSMLQHPKYLLERCVS